MNFDAKVRRESFEPVDLFYAHIGGMDAFAKGLKIAAAIRADGELARMVKDRYGSWDAGVGAEIEAGKHSFESLEKYMLAKGDVDAQHERPAGIARKHHQHLSVATSRRSRCRDRRDSLVFQPIQGSGAVARLPCFLAASAFAAVLEKCALPARRQRTCADESNVCRRIVRSS